MIYLISKKLKLFVNGFIIDDNTSRLDNWAKNKEWIGLDTETSSLKYWNGDLNLIQFGDFDNQFVVDMHSIPITDLLPIFSSKKFILQNAKFDLQWLKKHGVELEYIYDTLLAENILYCGLNPKKSLDHLVMKYCGIFLSKSERGTANYLNNSHIVYAANDVKYLHLIKEQQEKDCAEKELEKIFELEFEFVKIVAEMEYYGLQLNKDLWKELTKKAEAQVESTIIELDKIVRADIKLKRFIKPVIQSMMFGFSEREIDINYASPIQILKVLKALGFDKLKDTNENSLSEFEHEFIDKLLEFRGASKLANTYGEEFLEMVRPDGSIATNYTQIVDTGRMASKEPIKLGDMVVMPY